MIPFRLSVAHVRRNKLRYALAMLGVAVTTFLFCALRSAVVTLDSMVQTASSRRLVTASATSLFVQLPVSMRQKLAALPYVENVTHWTWFGGSYKDDPDAFFARFGVDVPTMRRVYGDLAPDGNRDVLLSKDEWKAFADDRRACIVGADLAETYGWKRGSRFPLIGSIFPGDYEFTVAGVYEKRKGSAFDQFTMFFHWDYMNEVSGRPDRVSTYTLLLSDQSRSGEVTAAVDTAFKSSATPTRTFTERAFNAYFVQMWGNVPLLLTGVGIAVFFACFMITVNTMMLLARERVREVGILKAIGFPRMSLAGLSLVEAVLTCLVGAVVGVLLGMIVLREGGEMDMFLPGFRLHDATKGEAVGFGLVLGLLSGIVPAIWVARLKALDALRSAG